MLTANDEAFAFGAALIAIGFLMAFTKWAWRDQNIFKLVGLVVLFKLLFGRRNHDYD